MLPHSNREWIRVCVTFKGMVDLTHRKQQNQVSVLRFMVTE
jgi:hypothetical protein